MKRTVSAPAANGELVSVVVPACNVAATLDRCLASLEAQDHAHLEVLCLNDGSTDATSEVAHAHAARDPRIIVVDKPNEGYGATCNRGLGLARGTWVALVEPDDWVEPWFVSSMLACADELGGASAVDVVKAPYWRVFEDGHGRQTRVTCPYKGRVRPRRQPFAVGEGVELLRHHPAVWAALYRRGYLRERHVSFVEAPGGGWVDNPFLVSTLCGTERIAYVDRCAYVYVERDLDEAEAMAARNPTLPLVRWNDAMDAAALAGVDDRRVLSALALRGVNYALITVESAGMEAPGVEGLVRSSLERLPADVVWDDPGISPAGKRLFAQVRGLSVPHPALMGARYGAHLAGEAAYRLLTNGPGFALATARRRVAGGRVG